MFALLSTPLALSRPSVAKFARACRNSLPKAAAILALLILLPFHPAHASSRLKDVVNFEGVRDNMLVGYGLVVGLNGTGDSLTNAPFTERSLIGMLERLGINSSGDFTTIKTKNIAAVMVTATLPPFSSQGARIDVVVSTMGDAKSLQGGTLLVTPLQGADGEVYAVAQGSVSSGFSATGASGSNVTKGVPTSGRIADGAIVEREIPFKLSDMGTMRLSLRNPDFTTSERIAAVINDHLKSPVAKANDSANVTLLVPEERRGDIVSFMTDIEQLKVVPDEVAKVVIDEQSGVIVMGEDVHINTVAIAQGNLTIKISETPQVSQPGPLSQGGTTEVVQRSAINIDEGSGNKLAMLKTGVSLQDLVQSLNALGIGPRDMIQILQSIKAAGALQADLGDSVMDSIMPLGDMTTTVNALAAPASPLSLSAAMGNSAIDKAAQDFEAMFATQMLQPMFEGIPVDPTFGGGHGEEVMRSFMLQEYGKIIAKGNKLGIATQVKTEMLRAQEGANARQAKTQNMRVAQNAYATATTQGAANASVQ